ncbi:MAG: hypothetical protein ACJASJ_000062 [Candidatus Azotimanducaceae bacterium]|jgi:hypothetical protein|tara:strand:+ start:731 stop:937 length:207 start_codon:yes stop_codon:yes gene_type:complete
MTKKTYIHLEDSEAAVLQVASRIYAAYITTMDLTERTNHTALMRKAIDLAIEMAEMTDSLVISDLERR